MEIDILPEGSQKTSKFSTTWRPAGDYIHLKVTFLIQKNSIQVGGGSYLLWAIENFQGKVIISSAQMR